MTTPPPETLRDIAVWSVAVPAGLVLVARGVAGRVSAAVGQLTAAVAATAGMYVAYRAVGEPAVPTGDWQWLPLAAGLAACGGVVAWPYHPAARATMLFACLAVLGGFVLPKQADTEWQLSVGWAAFAAVATAVVAAFDTLLVRRPDAARAVAAALAVAGFAAPAVIAEGGNAKFAQLAVAAGAVALPLAAWPSAAALRGVLPAFAVLYVGLLVNGQLQGYDVPAAASWLAGVAPLGGLLCLAGRRPVGRVVLAILGVGLLAGAGVAVALSKPTP